MAPFSEKLRSKFSLANLRTSKTVDNLKQRDLTKKKSISASLRSLFTGHSGRSSPSLASEASAPESGADAKRGVKFAVPLATTAEEATAEARPIPAEAPAATRAAIAEINAALPAPTATASELPALPRATTGRQTARTSTIREASPAQEQVYPQSHGKFIEEAMNVDGGPVRSQPQEAHSFVVGEDAAAKNKKEKEKEEKKVEGVTGLHLRSKASLAWTAFKTRMWIKKEEHKAAALV